MGGFGLFFSFLLSFVHFTFLSFPGGSDGIFTNASACATFRPTKPRRTLRTEGYMDLPSFPPTAKPDKHMGEASLFLGLLI